jgi:hypothetical protein
MRTLVGQVMHEPELGQGARPPYNVGRSKVLSTFVAFDAFHRTMSPASCKLWGDHSTITCDARSSVASSNSRPFGALMPIAATNALGLSQWPRNTGSVERVAVTTMSAPRTASSAAQE